MEKCQHFQRGSCKFGSRCKKSHEGGSSSSVDKWGKTDSKSTKSFSSNKDRGGEVGGEYNADDTVRIWCRPNAKSFVNSMQMKRFIKACSESVQKNNNELLDNICGGDRTGLDRITEICQCDFQVDAGTDFQKYSFQQIIVGMLKLVMDPKLSNSVLRRLVNTIINVIQENLDLEEVEKCLEVMENRQSIEDRQMMMMRFGQENFWSPKSWDELLLPISGYCEKVIPQTQAQQASPQMLKLISRLKSITDNINGVGKIFKDQVKYLQNVLDERVRVREAKEQRVQEVKVQRNKLFGIFGRGKNVEDKLVGPGIYRPEGPRHDNDFANFREVQVAPTQQEVLSDVPDFVPQNSPGSMQQFYEAATLDSHCELHFRLLRHDLVGPLASAIREFHVQGGLQKAVRLGNKGYFVAPSSTGDNELRVALYRNIKIHQLTMSKFEGMCYEISMDQISHVKNKTKQVRRDYWDRSKRLSSGSLVGIWWESLKDGGRQLQTEPHLIFATVSRRQTDKMCGDSRISIEIKITHKSPFHRDFIAACLGQQIGAGEVIMLQTGGMFFAFEPVLKALQNIKLPLSEFLILPHEVVATADPPATPPPPYALGQCVDLTFLKQLMDSDHKSGVLYFQELDDIRMDDPDNFPLDEIVQASSLDMAQATALKCALTQQLALIQGPPGTGKTFIGIQVVQALKNVPQVGPILCVCFTNHALDSFLLGLMDAGVTNLVRVGGRSKMEELQDKNLRNVRQVGIKDALSRMYGRTSARMKDLKEEIDKLISKLKGFQTRYINWLDIQPFADMLFPYLIHAIESKTRPMIDSKGFTTKIRRKHYQANNVWESWIKGEYIHSNEEEQDWNIAFDQMFNEQNYTHQQIQDFQNYNPFELLNDNQQLNNQQNQADDTWANANCNQQYNMDNAQGNYQNWQYSQQNYQGTQRDVDQLMQAEDLWETTYAERQLIYQQLKNDLLDNYLNRLEQKMVEYEMKREELQQIDQGTDQKAMESATIIGMTTSGVAKNMQLINSLGIKVVIVEEAAEVLEAHILTSVSEHTQHLILIGDHEQLRPKPIMYKLSVESKQGYNLDISLFERLISQGTVPHSTLSKQRRMRPQISNLIRQTIYPHLLDHSKVQKYGDVKGAKKNVYFLDHDHMEGGEDEGGDMKSKFNQFEAQYVVKLARHFVMQGYYDGRVAIITPYLGQLNILRNILRNTMAVTMNEKDQQELQEFEEAADAQGSDENVDKVYEQVQMRRQVRLTTIDNFQGEESDIVILSLVRNNKSGKIGFVRAKNRINVLLSRAKIGLYIFGNAETLCKLKSEDNIWPKVITMLESDNCVGPTFPLVCPQHPNTVTFIKEPQEFDIKAPDGGCNRQCEYRLPCGHPCPLRCHSYDPEHKYVKCEQRCMRLLDCGHECPSLCSQKCGPCTKIIGEVELPCGHVAKNQQCHFSKQPHLIPCSEKVRVMFKPCLHDVEIPCHKEKEGVNSLECTHKCEAQLSCGHKCSYQCGDCYKYTSVSSFQQDPSDSDSDIDIDFDSEFMYPQIIHKPCRQKCKRILFCGHECNSQCHGDTSCPPCRRKCPVRCEHSKCNKLCQAVCPPCCEPCCWGCEHQGQCTLPCGAPCDRLPCDQRCQLNLACGHRCPSICGEPCPTIQFCLECGTPHNKQQQVDIVLIRSYEELTQEDLNEDPLIVLPCNHAFLMSTLDGHMELNKYYSKQHGRWSDVSPLGQEMLLVKVCPICKDPIIGIKRYGRIINKGLVDGLERRFMSEYSREKKNFDAKFKAVQVIEFKEGWVQELLDDKYTSSHYKNNQGIQECTNLRKNAHKFAQDWMHPPRTKMFRLCQAALSRKFAQEWSLKDEDCSMLVEKQLVSLGILKTDSMPRCRALIWKAQANQRILQLQLEVAKFNIYEYDKYAATNKRLAQNHLHEIRKYKQFAQSFSEGEKSLNQAIKEAVENNLFACQIDAYFVKAYFYIQMAENLHIFRRQIWKDNLQIDDILITPPGRPTRVDLSDQDPAEILERQHNLFSFVEEYVECIEGLIVRFEKNNVATSHYRLQQRALKQLAASVQDKLNLIDKPLSREEKLQILQSLIKQDYLMADPRGYEGAGRWFECPNGHPYVIGDCGGAMELSRCPECSARIGGQQHSLTGGNQASQEMNSLLGTLNAFNMDT